MQTFIYLHFGRDKYLQIRYLFIGLNIFPGPSAQNIYYLWRLSWKDWNSDSGGWPPPIIWADSTSLDLCNPKTSHQHHTESNLNFHPPILLSIDWNYWICVFNLLFMSFIIFPHHCIPIINIFMSYLSVCTRQILCEIDKWWWGRKTYDQMDLYYTWSVGSWRLIFLQIYRHINISQQYFLKRGKDVYKNKL